MVELKTWQAISIGILCLCGFGFSFWFGYMMGIVESHHKSEEKEDSPIEKEIESDESFWQRRIGSKHDAQ